MPNFEGNKDNIGKQGRQFSYFGGNKPIHLMGTREYVHVHVHTWEGLIRIELLKCGCFFPVSVQGFSSNRLTPSRGATL